jgi:hypothetical protein
MIYSVDNGYVFKAERVKTLQARHVEAILLRIRPSLMMRIDAAHRAEVVLGRHRIEPVQSQLVGAPHYLQAIERH